MSVSTFQHVQTTEKQQFVVVVVVVVAHLVAMDISLLTRLPQLYSYSRLLKKLCFVHSGAASFTLGVRAVCNPV